MAEYANIPASPACGQWETLLPEALDGLLKPAEEASFAAHKSACPACMALYEEARRGREWLEFLAEAPEAPAGLVEKILARTGPGAAADAALAGTFPVSDSARTGYAPAWQTPGFMGQVRRFAEARLMMTAAMAFFSIAMTLNLTGVRLGQLSLSRLQPSALYALPDTARSFVERQVATASVPLIRYYDHMRLVYAVQTTMRELRRTTQDESDRQMQQETAPGESKKVPGGKNGKFHALPATQPADGPRYYDSDFYESFLTLPHQPAHSGGSTTEIRERSTIWTA